MIDHRNPGNVPADIHPLKLLTRDQFAALGGDAVAYIKSVSGTVLTGMISDAQFDAAVQYQLVMSADGTPLMVSDSEDAVNDWLGDQNLGLATLH